MYDRIKSMLAARQSRAFNEYILKDEIIRQGYKDKIIKGIKRARN